MNDKTLLLPVSPHETSLSLHGNKRSSPITFRDFRKPPLRMGQRESSAELRFPLQGTVRGV